MTYIIFKVVDMTKSIKVSEEIQLKGLDQAFFKENYETICKNISNIIRKEEAQNKQVILFTCQSREAAYE